MIQKKISHDIKNIVRHNLGEGFHLINQMTVVAPEKKGVRVVVSQDGRHLIINNVTPTLMKRMIQQYPWLAELPVWQAMVNSPQYLQNKKQLMIDISANLVDPDVDHHKEMVVNF